MQAIGYNTQYGIQLAQEGRKMEALAYLRHAVRTESVNAEVWLWLAHVTTDLAEYRNCVHQALLLIPNHPTALQMQHDLDYQARGFSPPLAAAHASLALEKSQVRGRRLRRVAVLIMAILLVSACGLIFNRSSQNFDLAEFNSMFPFLSQSKRVQFSLGSEAEHYNFSVEVPNTWFLADAGSPSWREQRDRLQKEFPNTVGQPNLWRTWEADWGLVRRDPETGKWSEIIAILETSSAQIDYPFVPRLELVAISAQEDTSCAALQRLAGADESRLTGEEGYLETQAKQREDGSCLYFNTFEDGKNQRWHLYLPMDNSLLAEWVLYLPSTSIETLNQIVASLREQISN